MGYYGIVVIIVFFFIVINYFSKKNANAELENSEYSRQLTPMEVTSNHPEEVRTDDDLPPYTPPTPKTEAPMADLPPSYDETFDVSEARVSMNNASQMVNNDGSYVNMNSNVNSSINMPAPCVVHPTTMNNYVNFPAASYVNPYYSYNVMPEIVVDPMNNRTATVA